MFSFLVFGGALGAVPSIDTPMRTGVAAPADAGVVIGVEDYAFLPDVPHAASDALALYNALVYTRGVPAERVERLVDGNREQILAAIERAADLAQGGTIWVSFAGHGAAAPGDGSLLLVGNDAKSDPDVFVARSVSLQEVLDLVGSRGVLILDTCHAGRGADGSELVSGARFAVPTFALEGAAGTRVWTAARPTQVSQSYGAAAHGLFTYFVAGALRGWADGELDGVTDGVVHLAEAHAFATRAIATVDPSGQIPTFSGDDMSWVSSDALEAPPDLAALPPIGGVTGGLGTIPIPRPAPLRSSSSGLVGPVTWQGRGLLADGQGRTISFSTLSSATGGFTDTDQAKKRYDTAVAVRTMGVYAVAGGVLYGAILGGLAFSSADNADLSNYAPYAAVAAAGIPLWGAGALWVPKARKNYIDAANERL